MKYTRIWLSTYLALSAGLLAGCSTLPNTPTGNSANSADDRAGITPGPKGQKPLPLTESLATPAMATAPQAPPPAALPMVNQNQAKVSLGGGGGGAAMPVADSATGFPFAAPSAVPSAAATAVPLVPKSEDISSITASATPAASASPAIAPTATPTPAATPVPEKETDFFYFSYDDSASTAGVELTKNALKNSSAPNPAWARPWEFLNFEKFKPQNQVSTGLFKVSMGLLKYGALESTAQDTYELGVHVSAPELSNAQRRNMVLTLVVDVSGSMSTLAPVTETDGRAPTLMEITKFGLQEMVSSLKPGDIIQLVRFDNTASTLLEKFEYQGNADAYLKAVAQLQPTGGTNLNAGIELGYQLAQKAYDSTKTNRVLMLTDAFANIGEVDPKKLSQYTSINNQEGIYFSGLGVGQSFNEAFLNQLTEAGRGAYFALVTKTDASRAFKERFTALMNVAARDVQFRLDYPALLKHGQSAAEQVSKVQADVQPTNFSYNTSQYFWEQFNAAGDAAVLDKKFKLSIYYTNPATQQRVTETHEKTLSDILGQDVQNIRDAHLINLLTGLIKQQIKPAEGRKRLDALKDHTSPLATEYRGLLEQWYKVAGGTQSDPVMNMP